MQNRIKIATFEEVSDIVKALNSPLRRKILTLLYNNEMNIQLIAKKLGIPQSTCTVNVQALEKANLIKTKNIAASKGSQKVCIAVCEEVVLPLQEFENVVENNIIRTEMPIGLFTDYNITSPCGLLSEDEIIGYFDHVESFLNPQRAKAQLLWFTEGYVEYSFPVNIPSGQRMKTISIMTEMCSEFPGANEDWPSDITVWINNHKIGQWTSPGDMGSTRGRLTPSWWTVNNTQYGFLKTWKVTRDSSFIDGVEVSETTIDDLNISNNGKLTVRIGNEEEAINKGGINLFGHKFGNYGNDIVLQIELENL